MKFEKMKWPELKKEAEKGNIVLIPAGSIEQHGYHLPVDTDTDIVSYIAKEVSEKTNTLLLPTVYYGYLEYGLNFCGSVSVTNNSLINYMTDIVVSLYKTGFKKVLIINGHGGNYAALCTAV